MKAILAFLLAVPLFASMAPAKSPAGHYRLVGEHDVASELELTADGHFSYALAAGALDEMAEGSWTSDGTTVLLTTSPKPKPGEFTRGTTAKTSEAPLRLKVVAPNGRGIAGVDFRLGFNSGDPVESYTQEYGWTLEPDEKRHAVWVEFALAMYGLVSQRFMIDPASANDLTFVLVPNDLGVYDFEQTPLTIGEDRLIMHRGGATLSYVQQEK